MVSANARFAPVRFEVVALGLLAVLLVSAPADSQTTLSSGGGTHVGQWFAGAYGQTFTAPTANVMNYFTFWLRPSDGSANADYRGYVYEWNDATNMLGAQLFESAPAVYSGTGTTFTPVTTNVGGVGLTTGDMYIAFLLSAELSSTEAADFSASFPGAYAGGSWAFTHSGGGITGAESATWFDIGLHDLQFEMGFSGSVVPEPAALILLASGLLGLGGLAVVRRRSGTS